MGEVLQRYTQTGSEQAGRVLRDENCTVTMEYRMLSKDPWLHRGREYRVTAPPPPPSPFVPPPHETSREAMIRDAEEFDAIVRDAEACRAYQYFFADSQATSQACEDPSSMHTLWLQSHPRCKRGRHK